MKSQCLPKTGNCSSLNKQKTVNRSELLPKQIKSGVSIVAGWRVDLPACNGPITRLEPSHERQVIKDQIISSQLWILAKQLGKIGFMYRKTKENEKEKTFWHLLSLLAHESWSKVCKTCDKNRFRSYIKKNVQGIVAEIEGNWDRMWILIAARRQSLFA